MKCTGSLDGIHSPHCEHTKPRFSKAKGYSTTFSMAFHTHSLLKQGLDEVQVSLPFGLLPAVLIGEVDEGVITALEVLV